MNAVLIAGVGNIFHGDDGFGPAVAQWLAGMALPAEVHAVDFGIRGFDLAYALTGGCRLAILVDAVQRGDAPGTLYVIEPDTEAAAGDDAGVPSPHGIDPTSVLRLAGILGCGADSDGNGGVTVAQVLLIGCEPATFGDPVVGQMCLSDAVQAAVEPAAALALSLAADWLLDNPPASGDAHPKETLPCSATAITAAAPS